MGLQLGVAVGTLEGAWDVELLITLESVRKESLKLYLFNTLVVITKVVFECLADK